MYFAKIMALMILMLFIWYAVDQMTSGNNKFHMESASRTTTEAALIRSVEEGGIRTKHQARTDVNLFYKQFAIYGNINAGKGAMKNPYTGVYKVDRLLPYAAVQMAKSMESMTMKSLKSDKTIYTAKHRVLFIWDMKK